MWDRGEPVSLPSLHSLPQRACDGIPGLLFSFVEHRGRGSRVLRWPPLWRQHQSRCHPPGAHGNDRLCQDLLQGPGVHGHLPGELRRGWSDHHLLWGPEPQGGRGLCQDRKGSPRRGIPGWGEPLSWGWRLCVLGLSCWPPSAFA